jgi:hypothetical protein
VTQRGVAIGDSLDKAEHAYSGLTCATAQTYDEGEEFPACAGQVGRGVFIWVGGDPIDAIQLSPLPFPNTPTPD